MTELRTHLGDLFTVDRDYTGAIGEDVDFKVDDLDTELRFSLHPDEADELADALKHHAAEVRQINKENGLA